MAAPQLSPNSEPVDPATALSRLPQKHWKRTDKPEAATGKPIPLIERICYWALEEIAEKPFGEMIFQNIAERDPAGMNRASVGRALKSLMSAEEKSTLDRGQMDRAKRVRLTKAILERIKNGSDPKRIFVHREKLLAMTAREAFNSIGIGVTRAIRDDPMFWFKLKCLGSIRTRVFGKEVRDMFDRHYERWGEEGQAAVEIWLDNKLLNLNIRRREADPNDPNDPNLSKEHLVILITALTEGLAVRSKARRDVPPELPGKGVQAFFEAFLDLYNDGTSFGVGLDEVEAQREGKLGERRKALKRALENDSDDDDGHDGEEEK